MSHQQSALINQTGNKCAKVAAARIVNRKKGQRFSLFLSFSLFRMRVLKVVGNAAGGERGGRCEERNLG